ncbi:MAG: HlyD family secretion protein [Crocinitomicaceae bacterium]
MPESKEHIEIRSDEVQEIMSHVPSWMIRWGISLIFGLILMLVFISWFVKYPDVIQGAVTITTKVPPTNLVTKTAGEIQTIYFKDREQVKKGDLIATLGTGFSEQAKNYLLAISKEIKTGLDQNQLAIKFKDDSLFFGTIQKNYTELKTAVLEYNHFLKNDATSFDIRTLKAQIENNTKLRAVSYEQLQTAKKELKIIKRKYNTDLKLFEQKIISQVQLFQEEQKVIQAENNIGNFKKAAVQNSITITDLKSQLNSRSTSRRDKQMKFTQAIELGLLNIGNAIDQWGKNYQIIASVNGEINYLKTVNVNEYIAASTTLFGIVANNQEYIGYIDVPKAGYGKLKIGQKVRIKIDKYPYQQFGQLEGKVKNIALLANEGNYRVEFQLINGMESSYGTKFIYAPEMSGQADIITEDIRLLNRIFNKFRKVFD